MSGRSSFTIDTALLAANLAVSAHTAEVVSGLAQQQKAHFEHQQRERHRRSNALDETLNWERFFPDERSGVNPAADIWNATQFQRWVAQNNINSGIFDGLAEKERFQHCLQNARWYHAEAKNELEPDDLKSVSLALALWDTIIPKLYTYATWLKIGRGMFPKIPIVQSLLWNGMSGVSMVSGSLVLQFFAILIMGVVANLKPADQCFEATLWFYGAVVAQFTLIPFLFFGPFIRKAVAPGLEALAASVGDECGSRATPQQVQEITDGIRKRLLSYGITEASLNNPAVALQEYHELLAAISDQFSLGLNLARLPQKLPS